ncbi:MAG: hypothetical protein R6Y91_00040 [Desulfohalobium sp.]
MSQQMLKVVGKTLGLVVVLLSFGCGGGMVVPLSYSPAISPQSCETEIGVQPLLDTRSQDQLGQTHNGGRYFPQDNVSQWASQALFNELEQAECPKPVLLQSASGATPSWIIAGAVEKLTVNQTQLVRFTGQLRLRLQIRHGNKQVFENTYTLTQQRTAFPDSDVPAELLRSMLQDILQEAVPNLIQLIEDKRRS